MLQIIKQYLPNDYGNVIINFENIDIDPKIGIVIPSFKRGDYLYKTLESLKKCNLNDAILVIVDESESRNQPHRKYQSHPSICKKDIIEIIKKFSLNIPIIKIFKKKHSNMFDSIKVANDMLIKLCNIKYLVNIDSDTIHKTDFLQKLEYYYLESQNMFPNVPILLTGFNCVKKINKATYDNINEKFVLGGINLFYDVNLYEKYVRQYLCDIYWDTALSNKIVEDGGKLISLNISVICHIGEYGLWSIPTNFDNTITF